MSTQRKWKELIAVVVGVAVLAAGGTALAGHVLDDVASYTGCLSTGGELTKLKEGDAPVRPCAASQMEVHLGGGDITAIIAGTGLAGGADSGGATISLDPAYALPQGCSFGQEPKWNGQAWQCTDDGSPPEVSPLPQ
jgi:hypothetical protein